MICMHTIVIIIFACVLLFFIKYIYNLKREIRRLCDQISRDEYIYYVDMPDKEIERLAACVNEGRKNQQKRERSLEKQDISFKKLAADLSHDLRTPLTVIIGYLQLIRLNSQLDSQTQNYVERIEAKADYLKKLIDDLYMLFWSEVVNKQTNMQYIDIKMLAANLLKEYIQNSQRASEMFEISIPEETVVIWGNEKIFVRILCNLIDNALKYSLGNIKFTMIVEGDCCRIGIVNPCEAMEEKDLDNIFELFYTKDAARASSNGMGLYIAKRLAKEVESDIEANYKDEVFSIYITTALER